MIATDPGTITTIQGVGLLFRELGSFQAPTLIAVAPPLKILMHPQMWRNLLGRHHQRQKLHWVPPLGVVGFNVLSAWEEAMSSRIVLTIES